jgi:transposase-like protein
MASCYPSFLEPRHRCEQALIALVQEAHVKGVSTIKVERLVEQLGTAAMRKSQVSRLCCELDQQLRGFRERSAGGPLPIPLVRTPRLSGSESRAGCTTRRW